MDLPSTPTAGIQSGTQTAMTAVATTSMAMGTIGAGGMKCKITMLWNWNTVGACFLSSQWQITSRGMFAGSCLGVISLVLCLEMLRRFAREYDFLIIRQRQQENSEQKEPGNDSTSVPVRPFRPRVHQQAIRALLHTVQFAVAYFIMLLAMYYNGYLIICIFIGAYLGSFIFHWGMLDGSTSQASGPRDATVCCG